MNYGYTDGGFLETASEVVFGGLGWVTGAASAVSGTGGPTTPWAPAAGIAGGAAGGAVGIQAGKRVNDMSESIGNAIGDWLVPGSHTSVIQRARNNSRHLFG